MSNNLILYRISEIIDKTFEFSCQNFEFATSQLDLLQMAKVRNVSFEIILENAFLHSIVQNLIFGTKRVQSSFAFQGEFFAIVALN